MSSRQTIRKITPSRKEHFDAQFWPVVVALVVLSGITVGAILTLMRGPWMWGSLLGLPIVVAVTIAVLQRLNNQQLRRALQFAIVISMALHMLVLIIAASTDIFSSLKTEIAQETRKRPQRVILTSRRDQPRIWEQVTRHETTEQEVKVERQTAVNEPPQPIPIESKPREKDRQVSKTAERSQTVPRFDESLSQLRSSTDSKRRNNARNSPTTSPTRSDSPSAPAEQPTAKSSEPSEASMTTEKKTTARPSANRSESKPAKTEPLKSAATKTSPSAERAKAEPSAREVTTPSRSTARVRRTQPNTPKSTTPASTETAKTSSAKTPAETAPREINQPVTRRESKSIAERRSIQDTPTKQSTASREVISPVARRRETTPSPPSISDLSANPVNPKRSRRDAPKTASTRPIEAPSPATRANNSGDSRMQPTAAAITQNRSEAVGSTAARNVGSNAGSIPSTASRASDTAARRESTSIADATPALTATQRSNARRSVSNNPQVESAFKANTTLPTKLMGSKSPSSRTATAAATTIDSASTAHRSEISAEKGQSQIDIGPTKVVTESLAQSKAGGGGQPSIDDLRLEPVSRNRQSRGGSQPTLSAETALTTTAKNEPNSKSSSSNRVSPTETNVASDRATGAEAMAGQPTEALAEGPRSDHSEAAIEGLLAEDRKRRSSDSSPTSEIDEEDKDHQMIAGNSERRLAQAPTVSRTDNPNSTDSDTANRPTTGSSTTEAVDTMQTGRASQSPSERNPNAGRPSTEIAESKVAIENGSTRASNSATKNDSSPSELGTLVATANNQRSKRTGEGPSLPNTPVEVGGGTPQVGESKQGTSLSAAETNVEVDRSNQAGSVQLQIAAVEGPAGLTEDPSTRLGVRARPASRDSNEIQSTIDTRFKRDDSGSKPGLNPDAVIAKQAFQGRVPNQGGGGPKTEEAIELGLEFLIRHQNVDGSWSLGNMDTTHNLHARQLNSDAAATGLAIIAFQGAGYNHREFKYALPLNHAVDWLIAHQREDGCLYVESDKRSNISCRMYTHSIATLALTEAYGMTQDVKLREPIERAVAYIEKTQHREKGGWRYFEAVPNGTNSLTCRSTDTSVTGWMLMALQSARLSGFEVKPRVFERIEDWLDTAQDLDNPSLFRYEPFIQDSDGISREEGRNVSPAMTSVGLLMRLYLGWNRDDERFQNGVDYLLKNMPSDTTIRKRDTYYWYYATQVMRHAGGEKWQRWNAKLHPLLVGTQEKSGDMSGSWHPYLPVPDRWGGAGGRIYVTTMNLLSLEVNYRLLPLYDDSSK